MSPSTALSYTNLKYVLDQERQQGQPRGEGTRSNRNMEDSGEKIYVEQTFCRVLKEKASGPIFLARMKMIMMINWLIIKF